MFYVTTLFFFLEIFHSKLLGVKASYVTPCIQSLFITYIVYYAMQVTNFSSLFISYATVYACTIYLYCGVISHRLLSGVRYVPPMEQINSRDINYYQCQHVGCDLCQISQAQYMHIVLELCFGTLFLYNLCNRMLGISVAI